MTSLPTTAIVAGLLYATMVFKKTRKAHIQRFNCTGRSSGGRIVVVNCKLQNKRIHWEA